MGSKVAAVSIERNKEKRSNRRNFCLNFFGTPELFIRASFGCVLRIRKWWTWWRHQCKRRPLEWTISRHGGHCSALGNNPVVESCWPVQCTRTYRQSTHCSSPCPNFRQQCRPTFLNEIKGKEEINFKTARNSEINRTNETEESRQSVVHDGAFDT